MLVWCWVSVVLFSSRLMWWVGMLMWMWLLFFIRLMILLLVVFGEMWLIDRFEVLLEKWLLVSSVYCLFSFFDFR